MTQELREYVRIKIQQVVKGLQVETNKFEAKRQWYNLASKQIFDNKGKSVPNPDYYEFLKDCSAIANSYGREEGFIVIGLDDKRKSIIDSPIANSGLSDSSKVKDLILGNIDRAFTIDIEMLDVDGTNLAVIHIPPSIDKPHVVSDYWTDKGHNSKNVIFVRNGTSAHVAKRGEIDMMYYDRGNIVLDKRIEVAVSGVHFLPMRGDEFPNFKAELHLDNIGTRELLVKGMAIRGSFKGERFAVFNSQFYDGLSWEKTIRLKPNVPIVIVVNERIHLDSTPGMKGYTDTFNSNLKDVIIDAVIFTLGNGQELLSVPV